jgi:hypothetical protein
MACGTGPAYVTAIPLGRRLPGASSNLPGQQGLDIDPEAVRACALTASRCPYSVLLPVGFTLPPALPPARCALTAPFHPYRGLVRNAPRRFVLCGTVPRLAPAGRYPAPFVHGARTFLPGGLSAITAAAVRPTDRETDGGDGRRRQGAARRSKARARAAMVLGRPRSPSNSRSVVRVDGSATPSIRCGRKWRCSAVTTSSVAES